MNKKNFHRSSKAILSSILAIILSVLPATAAVAPPPALFQLPLNQIPIPEPPNLFEFVKNKPAAIRLGKAFFWDMQVGSDGIVACATCHFSAGTDIRKKNTINPGSRAGDTTFQVRGPNESLTDTDFPFHKRQDPNFQASQVIRDSNDVVGAQGVHRTDFVSIVPGSAVDSGTPVPDPVFSAGGVNMRRVTGRNTPSVINAVFNFNNFWDGRAHFIFNGQNPFGTLDTNAGVWFNVNGAPVKQKIAIEMASLASQATGPPLDDTEMSFKGRTFPQLGRKMLSLTPLGKQLVHPGDSVLGPLSQAELQPNGKVLGQPGLNTSYEAMIKAAFQDKFWSLPGQPVTLAEGQFSQMEANFSLFWGLAIQLYEATLISDNTPFDRFLGGDQDALTLQQEQGLLVFFGAGRCDLCHAGTEMTNASVRAAAFITNLDHGLIEQMPVATGESIIYDEGFNNTAVRPISDDLGRGGNSPFINPLTGQPVPLSFSAMAELQAIGSMPFPVPVLPGQLPPNFPVRNNGNVKVPGLRNVELTGPYFHNGDSRTLGEVVDFYTRGGNFPAANATDLDINIDQIGQLQNAEARQEELVAFMMSMTDERVRNESAPFDHPQIFIPNLDPNIAEADVLTMIPAKDASGGAAAAFALSVDPVPPLTNKASILVNGTKEAGSTVRLQVNSGAPIQADAPTTTTWTATIALATGLNSITVTGTDAASNVVTVTAAVTRSISDGSFKGGPVSVADALKALQIAVGLATPSTDDLLRGDCSPLVNGVPAPDGRIGVDDALVILKKAVGLIIF